MARNVTLLDLVSAVAKYARSDREVIATVAYMVNSGRVRLCGNFKGTRFDLDALAEDVGRNRPRQGREDSLAHHGRSGCARRLG